MSSCLFWFAVFFLYMRVTPLIHKWNALESRGTVHSAPPHSLTSLFCIHKSLWFHHVPCYMLITDDYLCKTACIWFKTTMSQVPSAPVWCRLLHANSTGSSMRWLQRNTWTWDVIREVLLWRIGWHQVTRTVSSQVKCMWTETVHWPPSLCYDPFTCLCEKPYWFHLWWKCSWWIIMV